MESNYTLFGIIPPMITPLNPDLSLDVKHTGILLEHLLEGGIHGLFILGTTGEFAGISQDVKSDLIRLTCRKVGSKIPVLVGITGCSLVESIDLASIAKDSGAKALVAAPPFYMNIGQEELQAYYLQLADSVNLPLMLYNMPSHTKMRIEIKNVEALAKHPNIIGIKDSSGDLAYFQELSKKFRDTPEFRIFVGPEEILASTLKMGGHGGVTGGANLFPKLYVQAFEAFQKNDLVRLEELQECILFLSDKLYQNATYKSSYLKGLKAAMSFEGLCQGILAPPLSAYSEGEKSIIKENFLQVKDRVNRVLNPS
ncbi:dihydrodipicolinate synthase family protein [Algoriphagus taiwanensis]|uniref:Dihydrodipicolinate synthase family protein n=1 Tax=Algoriphagus taiwanensis TaxID=1445656 RepID=A0ABQ6Q140_9BACT|nr:dihydrodipicolinate synthase family protein [Algoriphagus taiwanensis]